MGFVDVKVGLDCNFCVRWRERHGVCDDVFKDLHEARFDARYDDVLSFHQVEGYADIIDGDLVIVCVLVLIGAF